MGVGEIPLMELEVTDITKVKPMKISKPKKQKDKIPNKKEYENFIPEE